MINGQANIRPFPMTQEQAFQLCLQFGCTLEELSRQHHTAMLMLNGKLTQKEATNSLGTNWPHP